MKIDGPLASVSFVLRGRIVGKNAAYRPAVNRDGSYAPYRVLTAAARAFKRRVAKQAEIEMLAARTWPHDPWRAAHVRISWQAYNDRHDVDAKVLVQDAMSGIFYQDDRVVTWAETTLPIEDDGGPRLAITLELLEVISEEEADAKRARAAARRIARDKRSAQTPTRASSTKHRRPEIPEHIRARMLPS